MSARWWPERRPDEPVTAEFLGRVLANLGAEPLAAKARLGHYDDYFAPADVADGMELVRLVADLERWARHASRDERARAHVVIAAVKDGEFDGTREESQRWAASKDGQDAVKQLLRKDAS